MAEGKFSTLDVADGDMTVDEYGSISTKGDIIFNKEKNSNPINFLSVLEQLQKIQLTTDTGWQELSYRSDANFNNYHENKTPRIRKLGNIVFLEGEITPTTNLNQNFTLSHIIFDLPSGYWPSSQCFFLCQGSGDATWLLTVNPANYHGGRGEPGEVRMERYRNKTGGIAAQKGNWLPFNVSWVTDIPASKSEENS